MTTKFSKPTRLAVVRIDKSAQSMKLDTSINGRLGRLELQHL
jgi:hypothetical protein